MIDGRNINDLVQNRVHRVLDYAEMAVPSEKYARFRTLVLDEFGSKGFYGDLVRLLEPDGMDRNGSGRNDSGRKGGAP